MGSAATTIRSHWDVVYDSGSHDEVLVEGTGTTDRTQTPLETTWKATGDGYVVSGSVLQVGATKRGQSYVQFGIARGSAVAEWKDTLCQGYVYGGHVVVLDENTEPGPGGGEGAMRTLTTADPAANAEISAFVVPTNALWRPHLMTVSMAQGATDTPRPGLLLQASGVTAALIPMPADVAASTTVQCSWGRGGPETSNNVTGGSMCAVMPEVLLNEADEVQTSTQGLGTNSNYGVPVLHVEEWLVL